MSSIWLLCRARRRLDCPANLRSPYLMRPMRCGVLADYIAIYASAASRFIDIGGQTERICERRRRAVSFLRAAHTKERLLRPLASAGGQIAIDMTYRTLLDGSCAFVLFSD